MKTLLSIAGYDPSSGAGVTADLAVFGAHGYFGLSAITALTVQSTRGVRAVHPVDPEILRATLDELLADIVPDGVKIGMLATAANVSVVAQWLEHLRSEHTGIPVVLDPVVKASSGREMLDPAGLNALRTRLLPVVDWATPNREELWVLLGESSDDVEAGARSLQARYPGISLSITGGDADASDLILPAGQELQWLRGQKLVSNATHGTGCAFSSALLCGLAAGSGALAAAGGAKAFVAEAIRTAPGIGHGKGPLNLRGT